MKFVFTIQGKNFYDPQKGDCLNILGNSLVLLAATSLLRSFANNHNLYLYVPDKIFDEFPVSPSDDIKIFNRQNMSFIECLLHSASFDEEKEEDLIWINSRFIGFDTSEIIKSIDYKKQKKLDLIFSTDSQIYLTSFNQELNIKKNVIKDIPFFDRKRLINSYFFNRKFFVISHSKINQLNDQSLLKFDFLPCDSGVSLDQLLKVFPEDVIANLYLS